MGYPTREPHLFSVHVCFHWTQVSSAGKSSFLLEDVFWNDRPLHHSEPEWSLSLCGNQGSHMSVLVRWSLFNSLTDAFIFYKPIQRSRPTKLISLDTHFPLENRWLGVSSSWLNLALSLPIRGNKACNILWQNIVLYRCKIQRIYRSTPVYTRSREQIRSNTLN